MIRRAFRNAHPSDKFSLNTPADAVKIEFARRLQAAMLAKGWNQSDLARQSSVHLLEGKSMGRDSVSGYVRGKSLPNPLHLKALALALGKDPHDLLPSRGVPEAGNSTPALDIREMNDGNVWLRINQAVPWAIAIRILDLLKGEGVTHETTRGH